MLSAARNRRNHQLSQQIFDRMKKHFPQSRDSLIAASVLLANVYASTGHMEKASIIRNQFHQLGMKRKIGVSWTFINGQLFVCKKSNISQ